MDTISAALGRDARLEPQERGDTLVRPEIGVTLDEDHLGVLQQRGLDGGLAEILDLLELGAIGWTWPARREREQTVARAPSAGERVVALE